MSEQPKVTDQKTDGEDVVISGHNYDGIQEYDNPMPGWWVGLFWATIVFAPVYILGVHVFGFIDTYEDDLSQSMTELEDTRAAYERANPSLEPTEENLASYLGDQEAVEAGRELFSANCVACHGEQGGGLIGPNLTDSYWIHGPSLTNLYQVISRGVLDKGMTPFKGVLSPTERAQVLAYIRSIQGTEPSGAKEPQGDYYGDEDKEPDASDESDDVRA